VPLLVYVVGIRSAHVAIGTSSVAVALSALSSLAGHARAGKCVRCTPQDRERGLHRASEWNGVHCMTLPHSLSPDTKTRCLAATSRSGLMTIASNPALPVWVQNRKSSMRAHVFRCSPNNGHRQDTSACPFRCHFRTSRSVDLITAIDPALNAPQARFRRGYPLGSRRCD